MDQLVTSVLLVIKLFVLLGLGIYVVFAAIIVRQEQLMAQTVAETYHPLLRLATVIHLLAAVGVFITAIILL